jgi:hypothetical protein
MNPIRGHVIDDARLFGADSGYPTFDQLWEFVSSKNPHSKMEVAGDAIRIYEA